MKGKAVISLATGLEDPEKVTVAFLVAVGAAGAGTPDVAVPDQGGRRLAIDGVAVGTACQGCPPLTDLGRRFADAVGSYLACPICFDARQLARTHC